MKRWHSITLLSVIEKVVKTLTAYRLTAAAKTVKVLSETQMRNYINHSTEHIQILSLLRFNQSEN